MNDITRRPSRDVGWSLFEDPFDNLFEGFFRPMRTTGAAGQRAMTPAVDIVERAGEYVVKADLPGIQKDDIDVTLQDGLLTITGETKSETEEKEGDQVIRQERRYGKFTRSIQLGQDVDENKVKAAFNDGVLQLTLPKKEEVQPKKISVDIG
jgi:HSP20 family protein